MALAIEPRVMAPEELPAEVEAFVADLDWQSGGTLMPHIDPTLAPRLARRRARIARQQADLEARYKAEDESLRLWRDAEAMRLGAEADRLDDCLYGILEHERTIDPKRKSLNLPYGVTVSARKVPASIKRVTTAAATDALIGWIRGGVGDADRFLESRPVVRWEAFKATLRAAEGPHDVRIVTEDGEALPAECGVEYTPAHETLSVKVAAEGDAR